MVEGIDLTRRRPKLEPLEFVASLHPGRRFEDVRLSTFRPNPAFPSQAQVRDRLSAFVSDISAPKGRFAARLFTSRGATGGRGLYLDGGFGVGKTHLLAGAYFDFLKSEGGGRAKYLSFQDLMYALGALGMARAIQVFSNVSLLCIDEFELDDPGSTHLANTFLRAMMPRGCSVIATSNTPPGALGEGRFNAPRFENEIRSIGARFETLHLDGPDYRQRDRVPAEVLTPEEFDNWTARQPKETLAILNASALQDLLLAVHPARFAALLGGVTSLGITDLVPMTHANSALRENTAIRFVHFVDKVYESGLSVGLTGVALEDLFHESYRDRGYAKKYARCLSRLSELMAEAKTVRPPVTALP